MRRALGLIAAGAAWVGGIVTLATGLSPAFLHAIHYDSSTKFKVMSADADKVSLTVWNVGKKPSVLIGYHLRVDGRGDHEETLDLSDDSRAKGNNIILPDTPVQVVLRLPDDGALTTAQQNLQYSLKELNQFRGNEPFNMQPMTLVIDVEESDDAGGAWWWQRARPYHQRVDHFPARRIVAFLERIAGQS